MNERPDPSGPLDDELLGALLDDELAPDAAAEVARRVSASPEARQRLGQLTAANALLRQAFAHGKPTATAVDRIARPEPAGTEPRSARVIAFPRSTRWLPVAASLLIGLFLGSLLDWRDAGVTGAIDPAATVALHERFHQELRDGTGLSLDIAHEDPEALTDLIRARWSPHPGVPTLNAHGYQLRGARLVHGPDSARTVNVVYDNAQSVLLYATAAAGRRPAPPVGNARTVAWTSDGFEHQLIGTEPPAVMSAIADDLRTQIVARRQPTLAWTGP